MLLRLVLAVSLVPVCTHAAPSEEMSVARALLRHVEPYPALVLPSG
jgi:hypothetical protein